MLVTSEKVAQAMKNWSSLKLPRDRVYVYDDRVEYYNYSTLIAVLTSDLTFYLNKHGYSRTTTIRQRDLAEIFTGVRDLSKVRDLDELHR